MGTTPSEFIRVLTDKHRVLVLGGMAVIAHGLSRTTKDVDVWMEPLGSSDDWCSALETAVAKFSSLTLHVLPGWVEVSGVLLREAVRDTGLVRVSGLTLPLDVFRNPNGLKISLFDDVYHDARPFEDGCRLPQPLDIISTKENTGRKQDDRDVDFLEDMVRESYRRDLPVADFAKAREMISRYSSPLILEFALENPDPGVRELARAELESFAEAGDPFSQAILEGREIPPER